MVNRQETTALQVFQNSRLGKVRIVADAETGNPLFVAKDVAEALGIAGMVQAVLPTFLRTGGWSEQF